MRRVAVRRRLHDRSRAGRAVVGPVDGRRRPGIPESAACGEPLVAAVSRSSPSAACSRGCAASRTAPASRCSRRRFTNTSSPARRATRRRASSGCGSTSPSRRSANARWHRRRDRHDRGRHRAVRSRASPRRRSRQRRRSGSPARRDRRSPPTANRRLLLADALADDSWRVRRVAAEGHGARRRTRGGRHAARSAARPPSRSGAAQRGDHGARAARATMSCDAIVALLETDDADVRTYAALALGLIDDSRAVAAAARASRRRRHERPLSRDRSARPHRRPATPPTRSPPSPRRATSFSRSPRSTRSRAIGEPSVASRLLPLLDDQCSAPAAAACLGALGEEEVAIPLACLITRGEVDPARGRARARRRVRAHRTPSSARVARSRTSRESAMTSQSAQALIAAIPAARHRRVARDRHAVLSWLPFRRRRPALAALRRGRSCARTPPRSAGSARRRRPRRRSRPCTTARQRRARGARRRLRSDASAARRRCRADRDGWTTEADPAVIAAARRARRHRRPPRVHAAARVCWIIRRRRCARRPCRR